MESKPLRFGLCGRLWTAVDMACRSTDQKVGDSSSSGRATDSEGVRRDPFVSGGFVFLPMSRRSPFAVVPKLQPNCRLFHRTQVRCSTRPTGYRNEIDGRRLDLVRFLHGPACNVADVMCRSGDGSSSFRRRHRAGRRTCASRMSQPESCQLCRLSSFTLSVRRPNSEICVAG